MNNVYQHTVFCLCVALFLLTGCSNTDDEDSNPLSEEEQESAEVRPEVIFAMADDEPLYRYVESQGVVEALRQVTVKPKISGYVETTHLREGRWVSEGDTLLALDRQEWQFAVREAQNKYEEALSAYRVEKNARRDLDGGLGSNGNEQDSTAVGDRGVRIATGLAQAEVELERARMNLSYATITAPFSGTVAVQAQQRVSKGAYVSAGTELGQLVNNATVRVRFDVLESELRKVDRGMAVEVSSPGGEQLNGTISAVSPVVDTDSKTGEVIARVNNSDRPLRPGMTVEGRILIEKKSGKARIPRSAILSRDGGRTLIFKLNTANDEVQWVYVKPDAQNSNWAIVNHESIAPGDTLAVGNHFSLSHLQIVSPKMQTLQREGVEDAESENL